MLSYRHYRKALGTDIALDEITRNSRVLYDERVVKACVKLFLEKHFMFDAEVSGIKR